MALKCKICGGECGLVCCGLGFEGSAPADGVALVAAKHPKGAPLKRGRPKLGNIVTLSDAESRKILESAASQTQGLKIGAAFSKGRPLASMAHLSLAATKPWEALGMSRRTWYRRQRNVK